MIGKSKVTLDMPQLLGIKAQIQSHPHNSIKQTPIVKPAMDLVLEIEIVQFLRINSLSIMDYFLVIRWEAKHCKGMLSRLSNNIVSWPTLLLKRRLHLSILKRLNTFWWGLGYFFNYLKIESWNERQRYPSINN